MLHTLPSPKTTKKAKRIGRGMGTGVGGHTVGRGLKGATARSGYQHPRPGFEGGQNPISRRLPKYKGFSRAFVTDFEEKVPLKLSDIVDVAKDNKLNEITVSTLVEFGLIKPKFSKKILPKVLFDKEIDYKLVLTGIKTSKSAKEAIEKAGGSVEL